MLALAVWWPAMQDAAVTLRDGVGTEDLIFLAGLLTAVSTICGFVWWATKPARVAAHGWQQFWEDWSGHPAAPGRSPVPGVMERLACIDGEFQRNGGASLKDLAHSTARAVAANSTKLDELSAAHTADAETFRRDVADLRRTVEQECTP